MKIDNQAQHKVPQVYLKKFGYIDKSNKWMISVIQKGETFTRQKSIKSFTAEINVFDLQSANPEIQGIFEELNGDLETKYNNIVADLEANGCLTDESQAYLLQLIALLVVRSDYWRGWVLDLLNHKNKENFLQIILGHRCKDEEEFKNLNKTPMFRFLADSSSEIILNQVLLHFVDHLMIRFWHLEIVIIQSQTDKPWFTSTNPVVLHNRMKRFEFFAEESEIYFPVSPKHLVYLHYPNSPDKENSLRNLNSNRIYLARDEQNAALTKIIIENPSDYGICPFELKYRIAETS